VCAITKILVLVITLLLLSTIALADNVKDKEVHADNKPIDVSGNSFKKITKAPPGLQGKIKVADVSAASYEISVIDKSSILIKKEEEKGKHTFTNLQFDKKYIESLEGYNGKEIAVANLVNGKITNYRVLRVKDHSSGNYVVVPVAFSEVIVSGMTGWYTKTVTINPVGERVSFHVENATGLYVQPNVSVTYTAFDETNVSTYPQSDKCLVAWPLNGNANDISGNGWNGTITGATSAAGRSGASNTGYSFDGDGDYITYNCPDVTYPSVTTVYGTKITTTDSNHCILDFRADSAGRTGIYDYETTFYINNATSTTTLNSTANTGWNYAFYSFNDAKALQFLTLGARYNIDFEYLGWFDMVSIYNGTLTANERRVFSKGFTGIEVKSDNSSFIPLNSTNVSLDAGSSIEYVEFKSNNDTELEFTISAPFQKDFTVVREWDNSSTNHRVDISFTPSTNVTTGNLTYNISSPYLYSTPSMESNDSNANLSYTTGLLQLNLSNLTADTTHYYNVSFPIIQRNIESFNPADHNQTMTIGTDREFNVTLDGDTDVEWFINGSSTQSDEEVNTSALNYSATMQGSFLIEAIVPGNSTNWTVTVVPASNLSIESATPSGSSVTKYKGSSQQFSVWLTKNATIDWYVNGTNVQHHTEFNLTNSSVDMDSYTSNVSLEAGQYYNITAIVSDGVNTDSRTWILYVNGILPSFIGLAHVTFFATAFAYLRRRR